MDTSSRTRGIDSQNDPYSDWWMDLFGSPRVCFLRSQKTATNQARDHRDQDWSLVSGFTSGGSWSALISLCNFHNYPFLTLSLEISDAALSTNFFGLQ